MVRILTPREIQSMKVAVKVIGNLFEEYNIDPIVNTLDTKVLGGDWLSPTVFCNPTAEFDKCMSFGDYLGSIRIALNRCIETREMDDEAYKILDKAGSPYTRTRKTS